jgi:hypothetical protein
MTLKYPDLTVASIFSSAVGQTAAIDGQILTFPLIPIQHWRIESALRGHEALETAHTGVAEFSCVGFDDQQPRVCLSLLTDGGCHHTQGSRLAGRLYDGIKLLEKEYEQSGDEYEVRILRVNRLGVWAIWAHHPLDDTFVPLTKVARTPKALGMPWGIHDLGEKVANETLDTPVALNPYFLSDMKWHEQELTKRQAGHAFARAGLVLAAPLILFDKKFIQPLRNRFGHTDNDPPLTL